MFLEYISDFFNYEFLRNALIASVIVATVTALYSPIVSLKKMEFIGDGTAHSTFGGMAFALLIGIDYNLMSIITAISFALMISFFTQKKRVDENAIIGLLLPSFMAFGIICISFIKGYTPDVMSYLFGNILLVNLNDIWLLSVITVMSLVFFIVFYKEILFFTFDEKTSKLYKLPVNFIRISILVGVSLAIVSAVKVAGIILVGAFVVAPGLISKLFSRSFFQMIFFSILISIISALIGVFLSYVFDLPPGPVIVLFLLLVFLLFYFVFRKK